MAFLTPLFLILGIIAAPIIVLYMLRLRRKEVKVSSILLWQKLLKDRQANTPWQRLRRNILLILQLLILLALVLALARPFIPVPNVIAGSMVVLLDGSASMRATDVVPSRFEMAKKEIITLISDMDGNDQMTIILVNDSPSILASASDDKEAIDEALREASASTGPADWESAFALAAGAAQGIEDARIAVVSDGGLGDDLPALPGEVTHIPVGQDGDNIAITSLATRNSKTGSQLYAQINNYGERDQSVIVSLTIDGQLVESKRIEIPGDGGYSDTWDISEEVGEISLHLSGQEADFFAIDDEAWAAAEELGGQRVLLVTEGNRFLETALLLNDGIELIRADPGDVPAGEQNYDLYVYDNVPWPESMPAGDLLFISPKPPESDNVLEKLDLSFTGIFSNTQIIRLADSPIHQFVDWGNINIRQASTISAPWLRTLVSAEGGPLLMAGESDGQRIAVLNFRLQESDLPLQVAFPVLMANIMEWLNPGKVIKSSSSLSPGEPLLLTPGTSADALTVIKPDGEIWLQETEGNPVTFADTSQPGVYQITLRQGERERPVGRFVVNLFSEDESRITPVDQLQLGSVSMNTSTEENFGQREFWPFLAAAAVIILVVEWWFYHRGGINLGWMRPK